MVNVVATFKQSKYIGISNLSTEKFRASCQTCRTLAYIYLETSSEAVIDHNCLLENRRGVRDEGFVSLVIMDIKVPVCYAFEFDYEGVLDSVLA